MLVMGKEQERRPSAKTPASVADARPPASRGKPGGSSTSARLPVQRRPGSGGGPAATPGRAAATSRVPAIEGPLRPGERRISGDVEVEQLSAERALIRRGDDVITIEGSRHRNEGYAFHVEAAGSDAAQRVVRIAATVDVAIREEHGEAFGLVCHVNRVAEPALARTVASASARSGMGEILELQDGRGATLTLDSCVLNIDRADDDARFAYSIDPVWSGPDGRERIVHIVATPGVRARATDPVSGARMEEATDSWSSFGRMLVPHLVHVQDPALVPAQGTPIDPKRYLHGQRIGGISHRSGRHSLLAMTGTDGVTVRESVTGAAVRIAARDPEVGARFAYQIVTPDQKREIGGKTEIRVLTGPGVDIEILEAGLRPPMGPSPDSLGASNAELVLYETDDPALVPPQGAPLERELLQSVGRPRREPQIQYAQPTAGQSVALAVADTAASLIPVVGDAADLAELGKALATGTDRHGRPVSRFDMAVLGIAALIPLAGAGALRAAGRSTRGAARTLDELARKLGKTREEIDVLLVRIAELTEPDQAALERVSHALRTGKDAHPDDLRHVRESLTELGFHTDLGPAGGDIFLFPDGTPMHGMHALGEGPEVAGIRETSQRGAGMTRPVRHHVLPQEHRKWFEERGFAGKLDIDSFTVELDEAAHQALHGGGDWRLGRTWPGEWNRIVMGELIRKERFQGRKLTPAEILAEVRRLMKEHDIDKEFVPYTRRRHE
jgi:hypothetical protein